MAIYIEPAFRHGREDLGAGQAHNRTPRAVERTVPFGLAVCTLTVLWYALHGYRPDDITDRRAGAPGTPRRRRRPSRTCSSSSAGP